jgi:hypothetical protein
MYVSSFSSSRYSGLMRSSPTSIQFCLSVILVPSPAVLFILSSGAPYKLHSPTPLSPKAVHLLDVVAIPSPLLFTKASLLLDVHPACVSSFTIRHKAVSMLDIPPKTIHFEMSLQNTMLKRMPMINVMNTSRSSLLPLSPIPSSSRYAKGSHRSI